MLGPELLLFILVAFIAVFAAVMMLISENAVHSALFLILNFASVAFMYLMLNAPFLAMVQVTVYAGAIMVLFLFVIMLLGAERLLPEADPHFSWLTPLSVGLIVTLLLIASISILDSEIDTSEPEPHVPVLRVAHAASELGIVDVYVDGEKVADDLEFAGGSDYQEWAEGDHSVTVFANDADPTSTEPLVNATVALAGNDVVSLLILPQPINEQSLLRVDGSLDAVEESNTATLTVVNTVPCQGEEICGLDIADRTDPGSNPVILTSDLQYGDISPVEILRRDQYDSREYALNVYPTGAVNTAIAAVPGEVIQLDPLVSHPPIEIKSNQSLLWIIVGDTRAQALRVRSILFEDANRPTFGGAESIGHALFTTYLLPFEILAVLLLAAMVGTIILTTQDAARIRQRRNVRRMAAVPGSPTVEGYVKAMKQGEALPAPIPVKQLPDSTNSSGD